MCVMRPWLIGYVFDRILAVCVVAQQDVSVKKVFDRLTQVMRCPAVYAWFDRSHFSSATPITPRSHSHTRPETRWLRVWENAWQMSRGGTRTVQQKGAVVPYLHSRWHSTHRHQALFLAATSMRGRVGKLTASPSAASGPKSSRDGRSSPSTRSATVIRTRPWVLSVLRLHRGLQVRVPWRAWRCAVDWSSGFQQTRWLHADMQMQDSLLSDSFENWTATKVFYIMITICSAPCSLDSNKHWRCRDYCKVGASKSDASSPFDRIRPIYTISSSTASKTVRYISNDI